MTDEESVAEEEDDNESLPSMSMDEPMPIAMPEKRSNKFLLKKNVNLDQTSKETEKIVKRRSMSTDDVTLKLLLRDPDRKLMSKEQIKNSIKNTRFLRRLEVQRVAVSSYYVSD